MADLERTIKVLLLGEDVSLNKAMINLNKDFDQFSSKIQGATQPLADFGMKVAKAEAALIAMGVAGLAYAVNEFKNFEDVMLKVKGVIGANSSEYAQLTALTKDLGEKTRYTATEAAQGLEFLALAGFKTTDALTALPEVLNLAQAAGMDLGRAADIVTNIMTGYGVAVGDLSKANDVLTATFTNSNTNLEQLGQAFKMVGPVAKSLGYDLDETSAILGVLGNAGYQAEMGGTALRNILLALVAPAGNFGKLAKELGVDTTELGIDIADSANALKSLGVNVKDVNGELLPFPVIMDQMKVGLEKIQDPADRTAILIEIFGKRGGPQMAALLGQGSEAVLGLQEKIKSLGGITGDIAEQMESGIGGALRSFRSAFQSVAIEIGEATSRDIAPAVHGLAEVFRTISDEVDAGTFDPILDAIGEFARDTEQLFLDIAENLPEALDGVDFSKLVASFKSMGLEVGGALNAIFGGDLDLTTVDGLETAIQKVINILTGMTNFTAGFIEKLEPLLTVIGEIGENFGEMGAEGQKLSGWAMDINVLFKSLDTFKDVLIGVTAVLTSGALITTVKTLASGISLLDGVLTLALTSKLSALGSSFTLLGAAGPYALGLAAVAAAIYNISDAIATIKKDDVSMFPSYDDLTPGTQKFLDFFFGEPPEPINLSVTAKTDTQTLDDLLTLPIFQPDFKTEWEFKATFDKTNLDDLLSIPLIEDGIDLPIWAKLEDEALQKDIANIPPVEGQYSLDGTNWIDIEGEIDKNVPKEKKVEVKLTVLEAAKIDLERDLTTIKTNAETIQTAMEWSAKVDIADIEAAAKTTEAAFDSVGQSVSEVASGVADMFDSLASNLDGMGQADKWFLMDRLEEQQDKQNELIDAQVALTAAQTEYMRLKNEKIESGELAELKIDTTGLEPALELVMWQIIEKVQIRANENAQEFLLGLPSV